MCKKHTHTLHHWYVQQTRHRLSIFQNICSQFIHCFANIMICNAFNLVMFRCQSVTVIFNGLELTTIVRNNVASTLTIYNIRLLHHFWLPYTHATWRMANACRRLWCTYVLLVIRGSALFCVVFMFWISCSWHETSLVRSCCAIELCYMFWLVIFVVVGNV